MNYLFLDCNLQFAISDKDPGSLQQGPNSGKRERPWREDKISLPILDLKEEKL